MDIKECKDTKKFDLVSEGTDWVLYRNKNTDDYILIDMMTRNYIWIQAEDLGEVKELVDVAYKNTEDEFEAEMIGGKHVKS